MHHRIIKRLDSEIIKTFLQLRQDGSLICILCHLRRIFDRFCRLVYRLLINIIIEYNLIFPVMLGCINSLICLKIQIPERELTLTVKHTDTNGSGILHIKNDRFQIVT